MLVESSICSRALKGRCVLCKDHIGRYHAKSCVVTGIGAVVCRVFSVNLAGAALVVVGFALCIGSHGRR